MTSSATSRHDATPGNLLHLNNPIALTCQTPGITVIAFDLLFCRRAGIGRAVTKQLPTGVSSHLFRDVDSVPIYLMPEDRTLPHWRLVSS